MPKHYEDVDWKLIDELRNLGHEFRELKDSIMVAQETLDASLASLTSAVTAAVAALATANTGTSTPDSVVTAYVAGVDAQELALASATPPPAVTPAAAVK